MIQRWKAATTPAREWGPALDEHRIEAGYEPLNTPKDDVELNVGYDNIAMDSKETQTPM